jgi:hypothetical protein
MFDRIKPNNKPMPGPADLNGNGCIIRTGQQSHAQDIQDQAGICVMRNQFYKEP